MKEHSLKLIRAISAAMTTAPNVSTVTLKNWVRPYGPPDIVLTDSDRQLTATFFAVLCASFEAKLVTATEYHSRTNGQVEWYNRTLMARLHHYIAEHQLV